MRLNYLLVGLAMIACYLMAIVTGVLTAKLIGYTDTQLPFGPYTFAGFFGLIAVASGLVPLIVAREEGWV